MALNLFGGNNAPRTAGYSPARTMLRRHVLDCVLSADKPHGRQPLAPRTAWGDKSNPQFGQSTVLIGLDLATVGRGLRVRT